MQALVSSTGTFWDTVIVCATTELVLVNSGEWTRGLSGAALIKAVWSFADIANGLMAIPNLISLIILSGVAAAETRRFLWSDNLDAEG